ncbi:hypothetical protein M436DRAFT_73737 [Aureobasidium namibiae CBS 147.97]|uniref:F-box domain-containing protein n=1 Tax=Aureobasidium namibiae CBS 147.97 TaxID=1043004 RepID=A0A074WG46_9PEZI
MDDLPLELKQRVCSYLTPKDLKSLRLTSRDYVAATDRYLLPRIFLFNHPDSFQEIQDITNHPDLRHSVTTLVVDTSCLRSLPKYQDWARYFEHDRSTSTNQVDARTQRSLRRDRNRARWMKYQERVLAQRSSTKSMLESISLAFEKCPKLSNLIIECLSSNTTPGLLQKTSRFYYDIQAHEIPTSCFQLCLTSTEYCIWDLLKPVHDAGRMLESLVLLNPCITSPQDWTMPTTTIFHRLKHLRYCGDPSKSLASITIRAAELQSIGMIGTYSEDLCSFQSLFGGSVLHNLRACSLDFLGLDENDLVQFLLRQSDTLQELRITPESWVSRVIWRSFANRVRGQLPNLRRVRLHRLGERTRPLPNGLSTMWYLKAADILQDHAYALEIGPREIDNGLWKEYEKLFFPGKYK